MMERHSKTRQPSDLFPGKYATDDSLEIASKEVRRLRKLSSTCHEIA